MITVIKRIKQYQPKNTEINLNQARSAKKDQASSTNIRTNKLRSTQIKQKQYRLIKIKQGLHISTETNEDQQKTKQNQLRSTKIN